MPYKLIYEFDIKSEISNIHDRQSITTSSKMFPSSVQDIYNLRHNNHPAMKVTIFPVKHYNNSANVIGSMVIIVLLSVMFVYCDFFLDFLHIILRPK